jgi:ABC-type cobalamin/Fe3+-siderophores transport system ATPase subunit
MSIGGGLVVSGATVRIGTATLVDDVGFALPRGAMCAIAGLNGAGKTTLLHHVSGLHPAAGGTVHFAGQTSAPCRAERARQVALPNMPRRRNCPTACATSSALGRIPDQGRRQAPAADD